MRHELEPRNNKNRELLNIIRKMPHKKDLGNSRKSSTSSHIEGHNKMEETSLSGDLKSSSKNDTLHRNNSLSEIGSSAKDNKRDEKSMNKDKSLNAGNSLDTRISNEELTARDNIKNFTTSLKDYCENLNKEFNEQIDSKPLAVVTGNMSTISDLDGACATTAGLILGAAGGYELQQSGVFTILHELAHAATMNIFTKPHFQIQADLIDNGSKLGEASSFKDFMGKSWDVISGKDSNNDSKGGFASWGPNINNNLGEHTDPNIKHAIVNMAGSLPSLLINSLLLYNAPKVKNDLARGAMMGIGVASHTANSFYPISAAMRSNAEISNYSGGHDFMNFSKNISELTRMSPSSVAISTAVVYTSFVPIVAALGCLAAGGSKEGMISDSMIVSKLVEKTKNNQELNKLAENAFEKYKNKDELITKAKEYNKEMNKFVLNLTEMTVTDSASPKEINTLFEGLLEKQKELQNEQQKFSRYMMKTLPRKVKKETRKELMKELLPKESNRQKAIKYASIGGIAGISTLPILSSLGNTMVPALSGVASAVSIISPILTGVSLVANSQRALQDSKDPLVPQRVKRQNAAIVGLNAANLALSITTVAVPPLAIATIPMMIGIGVTSFGLNLRRQMIMSNRFKDSRISMESINWYKNFNNFVAHEENKLDYLSKNDRKELKYWLKLQRNALMNEKYEYPEEYKQVITSRIQMSGKENVSQEDILKYISDSYKTLKRK